MLSSYDALAALTLPPAVLWSLDVGGRRATWRLATTVAIGIAVIGAALTSGFVFAPMRVLADIVFVVIPIALVLAAIRARRRGARPSSLGRAPWWSFAAIGMVLVAIGVDAFFVEPFALEITRHEIRSARVTKRLRIVVLADLQFDAWGAHEQRAIDLAAAENPDLVVFPGDFVQKYGAERRAVLEKARDALEASALRPPLGSYAVEGNIEVGGWEAMFPPRMTTLVSGEAEREGVRVTGLSLGESFRRDLRISRRDERFHVVVGHAPDFSLGEVDADLLVAGHTHGGQVQLPLIGPLVTFSAVSRTVAAGGVFERPGGHLVVSRGVGLERGDAPRLRFLCAPEVVVVDVLPAPSR